MLFLLLFSRILVGQSTSFPTEGCPILAINTDPDNYSNPNDPNKQRRWNWMEEPNFIYYAKIKNSTLGEPKVIVNPFFSENAGSNVRQYAEAPYKDFHPVDGWELLYKQFGTANEGINNPYFILYNKYTGKIRIFINIVNVGNFPFTDCEIILSYDKHYGSESKNSQTAVLNNLGEHAFSPLQFQQNATHSAHNRAVLTAGVNDITQWMVADFNTLFDPCTCGVSSKFFLQVNLTNNLEINATIFGEQHTLVDAQNPQNQTSELGGFWGNVQKYTAFGAGIINGVSGVISAGNQQYQNGKDLISNAQKFIENTHAAGVMGDSTAKNISKGIGKVLSGIPYLGAVFTLASSLITMVKNTGSDFNTLTQDQKMEQGLVGTNTAMPNTKFTLQGGILVDGYGATDVFQVPGSIKSTSTQIHTLPIYDNPLGVFNLYEQPEFIRSSYIHTGVLEANAPVQSVQLSKKPKILLNPSSGLRIKSVEYAIVFENIQYSPTPYIHSNGQLFEVFHPNYEIRFAQHSIRNPFDPETAFKYYNRLLRFQIDTIPYFHYNIDTLHEPNITNPDAFYSSIGLTVLSKNTSDTLSATNYDNLHNALFQTNFLAQSCIEQKRIYSFSQIWNPKLKVKLVLEPKEVNSSSTVNEVVYMLTFPGTVKEKFSYPLPACTSVYDEMSHKLSVKFPDVAPTSTQDELNHYKDLALANTTVSASLTALSSITLNENVSFAPNKNYVVKSTGTIEINNTFNLPSSSTLKLIAGKEITVNPNTVLSPEVELILDSANVCACEKKPEVFPSIGEIAKLCNSKEYHDRSVVKHELVDDVVENNNGTALQAAPLDNIVLYPNPTENIAFITSTFEILDLEVYDISGKQLVCPISKSENRMSLDFQGVEKGLYLIKVSTANGSTTKQLLVK